MKRERFLINGGTFNLPDKVICNMITLMGSTSTIPFIARFGRCKISLSIQQAK